MNFAEIITRLTADTMKSLPLFSPELAIVITIVLLLLVRLFDCDKRFPGSIVAILGTVVSLGLAAVMFWQLRNSEGPGPSMLPNANAGSLSDPLFTGLLLYDPFTAYFRIFLLLF